MARLASLVSGSGRAFWMRCRNNGMKRDLRDYDENFLQPFAMEECPEDERVFSKWYYGPRKQRPGLSHMKYNSRVPPNLG